MIDDIFNQMEDLEKVPTTLLKEITPQAAAAAPDLNGILDHTDFKPVYGFDTTTPPTAQSGTYTPGMNPGGNNLAPGHNQLTVGNLLTPDMASGFMNILIPAAIVMVIEKSTNQRVVKSQFEATPKELEILKPVLQKYLDSINFKVDSPFTALIITVAFIYGSKTVEALNGQPKGTIKTGQVAVMNVDRLSEKKPRVRKPEAPGRSHKKKVV